MYNFHKKAMSAAPEYMCKQLFDSFDEELCAVVAPNLILT